MFIALLLAKRGNNANDYHLPPSHAKERFADINRNEYYKSYSMDTTLC
jgi:hypothetical protein